MCATALNRSPGNEVTWCPQHMQLTVCRTQIHEVALTAGRRSRRQPETALVESERNQPCNIRRSAIVVTQRCPPPSQSPRRIFCAGCLLFNGDQLVAGFFRAEFALEGTSGKDWLRYERTV